MGQDEKIREAQEILNWAITYLSGSITCKVIDYKHENYRVQFFTKETKLLPPKGGRFEFGCKPTKVPHQF